MKWVVLIITMFILGFLSAGCSKDLGSRDRTQPDPSVHFCAHGAQFYVTDTRLWYCADPYNWRDCVKFNTPGRYCVSKL